jgi:hypothetical protein
MSDPAEKYRDKLDPTHQLAMDTIINSYRVMEMFRDHVAKTLEAERSSHSIGHIVDPTMYRDAIQSKSWRAQVQIMRAAQTFIDDVAGAAEVLAKGKG